MENQDILQLIQSLVDEEHRLRAESTSSAGGGAGSSDVDPESEERLRRLKNVEEALDQCWDLLRQRRAKQAAGESADSAEVRPVSEVEGYQQ